MPMGRIVVAVTVAVIAVAMAAIAILHQVVGGMLAEDQGIPAVQALPDPIPTHIRLPSLSA